MTAQRHRSIALSDAESLFAFAVGTGALLLVVGASRRSVPRVVLAAASTPLLFRGVTGRWPLTVGRLPSNGTKLARAGDRGVHVRESVRLEVPIAEVFRSWRRLESLPRFMSHLERVTEHANGRSHWIAKGPGGLRVEWDAEIVNEVPNQTLAWRSLPGSDVVTAGAVNFTTVRGGRGTQVSVHLQYAPPAGKAGALVAALFGREPSQTIREDLRRFRQLLEAGEIPRAATT
jgi:uncharacterized membrane protein